MSEEGNASCPCEYVFGPTHEDRPGEKCGLPGVFGAPNGGGYYCRAHATSMAIGANLTGWSRLFDQTEGEKDAHDAAVNHLIDAGNQLRREIHNVIARMSEESDITSYQVIGALELVKLDIVQNMDKYWKGEADKGKDPDEGR